MIAEAGAGALGTAGAGAPVVIVEIAEAGVLVVIARVGAEVAHRLAKETADLALTPDHRQDPLLDHQHGVAEAGGCLVGWLIVVVVVSYFVAVLRSVRN